MSDPRCSLLADYPVRDPELRMSRRTSLRSELHVWGFETPTRSHEYLRRVAKEIVRCNADQSKFGGSSLDVGQRILASSTG
jgi:hypothetical protein